MLVSIMTAPPEPFVPVELVGQRASNTTQVRPLDSRRSLGPAGGDGLWKCGVEEGFDGDAGGDCDVGVAVHARRQAGSVVEDMELARQ